MRWQTVIFLHIPRTGGTTLQRIPDRNYGRKRTLSFYGPDIGDEIERFAQLPESQRSAYQFIRGHLYFGFHRFVPGKSTYVTFLREPIARALSFYSYARAHSDHYLHQLLARERLSLKALLEREATIELFNLQTRMIGGDRNSSNRSIDRSVLERAKENLRTNFCFVGLTEQFNASLLLLARELGWSLPVHVKKNASQGKRQPASIDARTRALLREANALDLELYEFAKQLFDEQLRRAGESFEPDLRRFQRLNFFGGRAYEHYESLIHNVKQAVGRRAPSRSRRTLKQRTGKSSV